MQRIAEFFKGKPVEKIGIASFGPLDLNKASPTYGAIQNTPKVEWRFYPFLEQLKALFPQVKKFAIDTDVNACAWAEFTQGNHSVKESLAYVTVGTGVGVGLVINGKPVHGLLHPEGGHMLIPALLDRTYDVFA